MKDRNVLAEAEVLLHYGRKREALALLEAAVQADPRRTDLHAKLAEWRSPERSGPWALRFHLALAPLLLVVSLVATGCAALWLVVALIKGSASAPSYHPVGLELMLLLLAVVLGIAAVVFLAVTVFLVLWFTYLKRLTPAMREAVEKRLPTVMQMNARDPWYRYVRGKFFAKPGMRDKGRQ